MGRPRKNGQILPKRMYQDKKSLMYYFVDASNKYHRLGRDLQEALSNYYRLCPHEKQVVFMADLIDLYIREYSPRKAKATHRCELKSAVNIRAALGHFRPDQVSIFDVQEFYDLRSEKALCRANRELSLLSAVFKLAIRRRLTQMNPTRDVERNNEIARRKQLKQDRYITDEQLQTFVQYAPLWIRLYIELKLLTGLRQVAMLNLTTDAVKEDFFYVASPGKRGDPLMFEWTPALRETIQAIIGLPRPNG